MAHHKRRRRRRAGIRGHCGMCMLYRFIDCHHRIPTRQETRARESMKQQLDDAR